MKRMLWLKESSLLNLLLGVVQSILLKFNINISSASCQFFRFFMMTCPRKEPKYQKNSTLSLMQKLWLQSLHHVLSKSSYLCSSLISNYRSLFQLFEETHIHHIFHKGNQCTDLLAKEGSPSSDSFVLYSHSRPSSSILHHLLLDDLVAFSLFN